MVESVARHILYRPGDADAPDIIKKDDGGVLDLCRVCGLGEMRLDEPCVLAEGRNLAAAPTTNVQVWKQHLDYSGEEMKVGEFRDPPFSYPWCSNCGDDVTTAIVCRECNDKRSPSTADIIRGLLATNDGLIYSYGVSDAIVHAEEWLAENGK